MATYEIVTGPSPRLAMLRNLLLRSFAGVRRWLSGLLVDLGSTASRMRSLTTGALAMLSSPAVYAAATTGACRLVAGTYRVVKAGVRWLGRLSQRFLDLAVDLVTQASPDTGALLADLACRYLVSPIRNGATTADRWLCAAGRSFAGTLTSAVVRAVTTRAAQLSALLLAVHALSRGTLAAGIVKAIPAAMTAITWVTNPLILAGVVGIAFACAVGWALLFGKAEMPVRAEEWDLDGLAATLNVEVQADGSVRISGIPATVPAGIGEMAAAVAADAAVKRLEKIYRLRKVLTRDDKRLLVKTAQEAVRSCRPGY